MNDNDLNNYPSAGVQKYQTKFAFLIDCDGGLNAAFHPKRETVIKSELIKDFPSNSDIFLFFNSNDPNIVKSMEKLKRDNLNVHVFPNIITNSKNGADMNLSFMLGRISSKYDKYIIITRQDQAYEEIKIRLENTDPRLKNHVELRYFYGPNELAQHVRELDRAQKKDPEELAQYVRELDRVQKKDPYESNMLCAHPHPLSTSPTTIKFTPEHLFHHCPLESWQQSSRLYRFAELVDHLDHKHHEIRYDYCSTCEKMVQENDWSPYTSQLFEEHFQNEHLNNQAGFSLDIWPV